ncbi:F-box/kelch-repeat protein At3g23880-like [Silene latifolia]|uniref:F-box/kelch-repeat protein At3g23880-like n=1 Tax=Silene latifolia TaxID=37657 RepID=UPI003D77A8D8
MKSKKKTKSSLDSTCISEFMYIPPEVCTQILANLPAKTLVKFRCVCKSWRDIIDRPDFVILHRKLCKINSVSSKLLLSLEGSGRYGMHGCLLTVRRADTLRKIDHIFKISQRYHLDGSCNELVLVRALIGACEQEPLMLWNPCIRKSLRIPLSPLSSFGAVEYTFGFAPCSNDYKIIAMSFEQSQGTDGLNMHVAVYTLSDQQWSLRNDGLNMSSSYFRRLFWQYYHPKPGFYFQGAAHWISNDPNGDGNPADCPTHLVSLDFDLEKFTYLELPFASDDRGAVRFPFLLRESLAVLIFLREIQSIWSLEGERGNGEWTQRFSGLSSSDGFMLFRSGPRLPLFYCESDDGSCFVYGKKSYNIGSCQVQELGKCMSRYVDMEMYMEGLVLCNGYESRSTNHLLNNKKKGDVLLYIECGYVSCSSPDPYLMPV